LPEADGIDQQPRQIKQKSRKNEHPPMNRRFDILFQNEDYVFIDKPAAMFVHQPEQNSDIGRVHRDQLILPQLRDQLGQYLHPLHRLDAPTTGVLGFAFNPNAANQFQTLLAQQKIRKTYWAVARGWMSEKTTVDKDLDDPDKKTARKSITEFTPLKTCEYPAPENWRYKTHRYTWVEAHPLTGRFHQIRRHLARLSMPVIGDREHGDSKANGLFKQQFTISGLCLRAVSIEWTDEVTGASERNQTIHIHAPVDATWTRIQKIFATGNQSL
jgi:tRNA pseudouridine65 synthase